MAYIDLDEINRLHPKLTAKYPLSFANGISAAINEINRLPNADVVPKGEVESIITLNSQLEEKVFEERGKVERLHGILLQFTDIVHKWGTKNNIDTSEISLVPIMNEEADSIIQKANQDVAREIFEEIDELIFQHGRGDLADKYFYLAVAELKKKYTEDKT